MKQFARGADDTDGAEREQHGDGRGVAVDFFSDDAAELRALLHNAFDGVNPHAFERASTLWSAPVIRANYALALVNLGRNDEAIEKARAALDPAGKRGWQEGFISLADGLAAWVLARAGERNEVEVDDGNSVADAIFALAAGHPYIVHTLGHALVDLLNEEQRTDATARDVIRVIDAAVQWGECFHAQIWDELEAVDKAAVMSLANGSIAFAPETLARLQAAGMLDATGSLVPLFARWVFREVMKSVEPVASSVPVRGFKPEENHHLLDRRSVA